MSLTTRNSILLSTFLLSVVFSYGQKANKPKKLTVSSIVTDSAGQYMPFASVVFTNQKTGKKTGITTNESDGSFSVEIPPGEYLIESSFIGFIKYTQNHSFIKDTVLPDIILKEKNIQLDEVIIRAEMEKSIEHNANGMTFNVKNDSLYKKLSASQVLSYLPGVTIDQSGAISLHGDPAMINFDGKTQRLSASLLSMVLESMQGDQIESIELIDTPSAKHSGRVKKIIDLKLKKQRKDGLLGSLSVGTGNVDFRISPYASLNYKTGKVIFSTSLSPYSYFRRSNSVLSNRGLIDNSLSFEEEQKRVSEYNSSYGQFGVDYTINKHHSISGNVSLYTQDRNSQVDFTTDQFSFGSLTNKQLNANKSDNVQNSTSSDLSYRYDIDDKGARLDMAIHYRETDSDTDNTNFNELENVSEGSVLENRNQNSQKDKNKEFSGRLDYFLPFKDKKGSFETGLKYDDLSITNFNIFEIFNSSDGIYEPDPNLSNSFEYNEHVYSSFASLNSSYGRLKYSVGLRLEHVETQSFSITQNQAFENKFTNVLPVISLKYMTNKEETNSLKLSYRKGYNLPPYIQLNPFEIFVNSNTIRRGNPDLKQSVYHLFVLGYTIKNKYFFRLNSNFYNNIIESVQILEDDISVLSYQNVGKRIVYRFNFNTNFNIFTWWKLNTSAALNHNIVKGERANNEVTRFRLGLRNTFNIPGKFTLGVNTSFSNGNSNGFGIPNDFIRAFTTASLSKRFWKNKASFSMIVSDIFGVMNREEETYIIDNTIFSKRNIIQRPSIGFNLSYKFSSGERITKKPKKKSEADGSRF